MNRDSASETDAEPTQGRWVQERFPVRPEGELRDENVPESKF